MNLRSLTVVRIRILPFAAFLLTVFTAAQSYAASAGMPWEGPISKIVSSITGPVAKGIGILAIVSVGVGLAFSEGGSGLRKVLGPVMGLAIAFSAASWGLGLLGFSGGALL